MASRPTSETSSRSSTSSPESAEDVRAHSAIHVLKGAITSVLGTKKFTFASKGVLRLAADGPITKKEVSRIETAANRKMAEDAEILEFEMDRAEAEGHFGRSIYDLLPASSPLGMLRVVRIPEWDASCCGRRHVESTGSIGAIRIDAAEFDAAKKELELRFHLL